MFGEWPYSRNRCLWGFERYLKPFFRGFLILDACDNSKGIGTIQISFVCNAT
jgi:hypothetical protein